MNESEVWKPSNLFRNLSGTTEQIVQEVPRSKSPRPARGIVFSGKLNQALNYIKGLYIREKESFFKVRENSIC
jgi:hypothetical protein